MVSEQTKSDGVGLSKGAKVGKYEIVDRIGMGGQAIVYKGYDALLDRHVALKQISSHLAGDPKFLERFRKEAQILAKLGNEQESVVTIHELIEDEHGLFIVMEYLAGSSLEKVLEDTKGPVEAKATLQIIWRLAAALHAVHSAGIIHRDLKPSNIIIGEGLRAKITDFGVAAMSGDASMALGTTKYMAPELYGDHVKVDGRVDMYSLGFIAYEMLIGRPRFNEIFAEVIRDKHGEQLRWMKWHGNQSVAAPLLHEVDPSVPAPLSEIVARMMAKDPDKRFRDMEDLGRTIKSAFSPRAKSGKKARAKSASRRHVAVGAAAGGASRMTPGGLTADDSGAAMVPPDAGDELEVLAEPQGAMTAPLPNRRPARKLLLFFVLPAILIGAVGGGVWGVYQILKGRGIEVTAKMDARRIYSDGVTDMNEGIGKGMQAFDGAKFASAVENFKKVAEKYPRSDQARKAAVLRPVCEGYVAILAGNWAQAVAKEVAAADENKKLQSQRSDLREWTNEAGGRVKNLVRDRKATQSYREAEGLARKEFEAGRHEEARQVMYRELVGVSLTPQLDAERLKFLEKVDQTEFRAKIQALIQRADDMVQQDKFTEAEDALDKGRDLLDTDQVTVLPSEEVATFKRTITDKLKKLNENRTLNDALESLERARAGGDKGLLLVALRALYRRQPSEKITEEIATIQSDLALARGRELKAAGKISEAREWFKKSRQFKENNEAKQEEMMLDQAQKREDVIAAGDSNFLAAKWAEALAEYQKAAKLGISDNLSAKIVECNYRIKLTAADKFRAEKNYDEAVKAFQEAQGIKPASAPLIQARLEEMAADRQYEKLMAEGNEFLKRAQWVRARDLYSEAQKIRNTAEIQEAIVNTRYGENFARGMEAWEQKDYDGALGYFNLAKSFKSTKEVIDWITKVEAAKKAAGAD